MRRNCVLLTVLAFLSFAASAQYGTAPNNYYPENYTGSIFTGVVADAKNNQITLTYTKGSKMETFTGVFEKGCSVPSRDGRSMMPTDIPPGSLMTAFFNATTKKVDGKKTKENPVLAIAFDVWQGQKVAEDKKAIYWCTDQRHLKFQAH